jgi:hypothetical protein
MHWPLSIANIPIGQAPQALAYVTNAVPEGVSLQNLQPLGVAGMAAHLSLAPADMKDASAPTSVTLFDQGLTQVLEAAVGGLAAGEPYVLALSTKRDGHGALQPLASFKTNPAGAAVVNAVGPIRQIVQSNAKSERRYLVIVSGTADKPGETVQVQRE